MEAALGWPPETSEGQARSASFQGDMQRQDDPPPGQNVTAGTPGLLTDTGAALFEAFFCSRDKGGITRTELPCLQPSPAMLTMEVSCLLL